MISKPFVQYLNIYYHYRRTTVGKCFFFRRGNILVYITRVHIAV